MNTKPDSHKDSETMNKFMDLLYILQQDYDQYKLDNNIEREETPISTHVEGLLNSVGLILAVKDVDLIKALCACSKALRKVILTNGAQAIERLSDEVKVEEKIKSLFKSNDEESSMRS